MKTADIERVIGHKPGANGFQVTAANIANVRDWMVSQGISRDRANACRASTLERVYRYPQELRKLLWRGDYKGGTETWNSEPITNATNAAMNGTTPKPTNSSPTVNAAAPSAAQTMNQHGKRNSNDINGTAKPRAMGANPGAQQQEHALAASAPQPDTTGEGIGGGGGQASLTNTIEGIVCGEFADDDVVRLFNACKAHLGE
jgi:hypothetical protein